MSNLLLNATKWLQTLPISIEALYKNGFKNTGHSILQRALNELLVTNFKIWEYEDEVRRKNLPDKDIVNLKRDIDTDNQKRNDLIDFVDKILIEDIEKKAKSINKSAALNSETPASIFDRLTILGLRTYHLKKEVERKNIDKSHIKRCSRMLKESEERTKDLLECLETLLTDYYTGKKRLKSYKQHKLYNDPELNLALRK